ncbi:polysaccharide deacetylase family protein [[Clostridium] colinum]|uniref:polysaccharide deacetylase family protein n=1 Tax=[Clostridium] colinum TaxID=36835 RepID=UPI0020240198|nr:polysaccharide deacetylase family protein [[Clostridium] colinum]
MNKIMKKYNFNIEESAKKLWISKEQIKDLHKQGNVIGLHSHTHPTDITKLSKEGQYKEYLTNKNILEDIINDNIICMSHPCGRYNNDTLEVLKNLNIKIGFTSNMILNNNTKYEFLREDHANIFNNLRKNNNYENNYIYK